jgi:hypothetical protein
MDGHSSRQTPSAHAASGRRASGKIDDEMFRKTVLLLLLFAGLSLITTLTFAFGPLMLDSFLSTAPPI